MCHFQSGLGANTRDFNQAMVAKFWGGVGQSWAFSRHIPILDNRELAGHDINIISLMLEI